MIKWREGKAGFVGGSKRLIKGAINFVYTVTSDIVAIPEIVDGVVSSMSLDGHGVTGAMTSEAGGIVSTIENSGIISPINSYGGYALSTIDEDGGGITSTM